MLELVKPFITQNHPWDWKYWVPLEVHAGVSHGTGHGIYK